MEGEWELDDGWVRGVLEASAKTRHVLENAERHRLQVLVSVVRRGRLLRRGLRVGHEYIYPASCVKTCAVVGALRELKRLGHECDLPITLTSALVFHPQPSSTTSTSQMEALDDTNLPSRTITAAHEIRKLFLVSDNRAYNRLFALVGRQRLNEYMWRIGLTSARLYHRLYDSVPEDPPDERISPAVEIWCQDSQAVGIPMRRDMLELDAHPATRSAVPMEGSETSQLLIGSGYIDSHGVKVDEPFNFAGKNVMSLMDLQDLHVKLFRPDLEEGQPGLELDEGDRLWLIENMYGASGSFEQSMGGMQAQYPSQSSNPIYKTSDYPDEYGKFLLPGVMRVWDKRAIRIFNKLGRAYGFSIDNAYVMNIETGDAFFLSASIYTNANGILNDDKYEYDLADTFLEDLGEVITRALCAESAVRCTPQSFHGDP